MSLYTTMKETEFITLTEMWQDGKYLEVTEVIADEDWSHGRLVRFCDYMAKYLGIKELNVFSRMI